MNHALIFPMFAMVVLTAVVLVFTFLTRVRAVRSGQVDFRYFKTFSVGEPTEAVLKTGRHFSNLFEVPVLFYSGCIVAMQMGATGFWPVLWAWVFVAARVVHAWIHIGSNKIYPRMGAFALGSFAAVALWTCVFIQAL